MQGLLQVSENLLQDLAVGGEGPVQVHNASAVEGGCAELGIEICDWVGYRW